MRLSKPKKPRRPDSYYRVAGVDLRREMRWLCTLPTLGGAEGELARHPPTLAVRRSAARPRRNLGFAVPSERRISVTAYPGIRPGDVQETLLHELVHIAVGRQDRRWHGRHFKRTLTEAMGEAYGVSVAPARGSIHGAYADALEQRRRTLARSRRDAIHPAQLVIDSAA